MKTKRPTRYSLRCCQRKMGKGKPYLHPHVLRIAAHERIVELISALDRTFIPALVPAVEAAVRLY